MTREARLYGRAEFAGSKLEEIYDPMKWKTDLVVFYNKDRDIAVVTSASTLAKFIP